MAAERFTITKFTNPSGEQVWRVEGRMPDGHRVRQNFGDRADAIAKKAELELQALNQPVTLSLKRTRLTDEQLTEAEAEFLKLDGKGSLLAAVHHYLISGQKKITRIIVREAYDLFMADAVGRHLRPRTIQELRSRVGFLVADSGTLARLSASFSVHSFLRGGRILTLPPLSGGPELFPVMIAAGFL